MCIYLCVRACICICVCVRVFPFCASTSIPIRSKHSSHFGQFTLCAIPAGTDEFQNDDARTLTHIMSLTPSRSHLKPTHRISPTHTPHPPLSTFTYTHTFSSAQSVAHKTSGSHREPHREHAQTLSHVNACLPSHKCSHHKYIHHKYIHHKYIHDTYNHHKCIQHTCNHRKYTAPPTCLQMH